MKIKTFDNVKKAKKWIGKTKIIRPVQIRMLADVNADDQGNVWVLSDAQNRYIRENGVLA